MPLFTVTGLRRLRRSWPFPHLSQVEVVLLALPFLVYLAPAAPPADETPLAAVQRFAAMLNSPQAEERRNAAEALHLLASEAWDEASFRTALEALAQVPADGKTEQSQASQFWVDRLATRLPREPWATNVAPRIVPQFLQSPMPGQRKIGVFLASYGTFTNQDLGPWIIPLLEDPDLEIQQRAARVMKWHMPKDPAERSNVLSLASRKLQSPTLEEQRVGLTLLRAGDPTHQEAASWLAPLMQDPGSEPRDLAAGFLLWKTREDPAVQSNLVATLSERLRSPDLDQRKTALAVLTISGATNQDLVSWVRPLLEDPHPDLRERAALFLFRQSKNDPSLQSNLVAVLTKQLASDEEGVRLSAAQSLVEQARQEKDQALAGLSLRAVVSGLDSADAALRSKAAQLLPRLAPVAEGSVRGELEQILVKAAGHADPEVAAEAASAVGQWPHPPEKPALSETLATALATSLSHTNADVREAGLSVLERLYRPTRVTRSATPDGGWRVTYSSPIQLPAALGQAVVTCLSDEDPRNRMLAAALAHRDEELSTAQSEALFDLMLQHYASTNAALRPDFAPSSGLSAAQSQALVDLMQRHYASTNAETRRLAFTPLELVSWTALDAASRRRLQEFWRGELRTARAPDCLEALGLLEGSRSINFPIRLLAGDDGDYVAVFFPALESSHPSARAAACEVLARNVRDEPRLLRPLPKLCEEMAHDPWPQVSAAALRLMDRIAEGAQNTDADPAHVEAQDRLQRMLTTAPLLTRARVATRLRATPDKIEELLAAAAADPEPLVRLRAVRRLKQYGAYVPLELLDDPDPAVRAEAAVSGQQPRSTKALLALFRSNHPDARVKGALGLSERSNLIYTNQALMEEVFSVLVGNYRAETAQQFRALNQAIVRLAQPQLKEPFQDFIRAALRSPDPFRRAGAWALLLDLDERRRLSRDGPAQAVLDENPGLLLEATRSTNATIRVTAFQLLNLMWSDPKGPRGAFADAGPEPVRVMLAGLKDPEPIVLCVVAEILAGQKSEPTTLGRKLLEDEAMAEEAWQSFRVGLEKCPGDLRQWLANPLVVLAAAQPNDELLRQALNALLKPSDPRGSGAAGAASAEIAIHSVQPRTDPSALWPIALACRQETSRRLVLPALLEMMDDQDSFARRGVLNRLENSLRSVGLPHPEELEPLVAALLPLAASTNAPVSRFSDEGRVLARALAAAPDSAVEKQVEEWVAVKAKEADPRQRLQAMLLVSRLSLPGDADAKKPFLPGIRHNAIESARDPDEAVRAAAFAGLLTLSRADRSSTVDPGVLQAGLNDRSAAVKAAAVLLVAHLAGQPSFQKALGPLAHDFIKSLPSLEPDQVRAEYRLHESVQRLATQAKDQAVCREVIQTLEERAAQTSLPADRAVWLQLLGEIQLATDHPRPAAEAFEQASALVSNAYERKRLEELAGQARFTAGDRSAVLDESILNNGTELRRRLDVLARNGEWEPLLQAARQLLARPGLPFAPRSDILRLAEETLGRLGKEKELESFLEQEAARRPKDVDVMGALAKWQAKQGGTEQALATHEKALLASKGEYPVEDLRRLCQKTRQMDRFERLCRQVLEAHPEAFYPTTALTEEYMRTSRTNEARALAARYQQIVEKSSRPDSWARSRLVDLLEIVRDYDGAIAVQRQLIESAQGRNTTYLNEQLVKLYRLAGRTNELSQLAQSSPELAVPVLQQRLQEQAKAGQYTQAKTTAEQLLASQLPARQREEVWNTLFSDLFRGKGLEPLLSLMSEARQTHPQDPALPKILGAYYSLKGDWPKAIEQMEKAHELAPDDVSIAQGLAGLYLQAGQPNRAIEFVQSFAQGDEDRLYNQDRLLAGAYMALGDTNHLHRLASSLRERVGEESAPSRGSSLRDLAWIESLLGRHGAAVDLIGQAMADPQASSWESSDLYFLAGEHELAGNPDKAIASYQRLLGREPRSSYLHMQLARLYQRLGKTAEAAASLVASQERLRKKISDGQAGAEDYNNQAWFYVENRILAADAVRFARQALALASTNLNFADTLGWALLQNGESAGALDQFALILTNAAAQTRVRQSSWMGLNSSVDSEAAPSMFGEFTRRIEGALPPDALSRLWLILAQAHYEQKHGDPARAAALRASVGCPDERNWLILGPFPRRTAGSLSHAFIPEEAVEIDREASYPGRVGTVKWETREDGHPDGLIEFDRLFPGVDWAVAYAWLVLESEREQTAVMHLGSDDQIQVWLNGASVWQYTKARSFGLDQDAVPVTLRPGRNTILVKVGDERWHWKFHLRLTDPEGKPLPGVTF